jgi:hypothetical protein
MTKNAKVVHAVTARGAKIIRRTKDDTWYLKRGAAKIPLTIKEAACIAVDGYVFAGRQGGESFEQIVHGIWSRSTAKTKDRRPRDTSNSPSAIGSPL